MDYFLDLKRVLVILLIVATMAIIVTGVDNIREITTSALGKIENRLSPEDKRLSCEVGCIIAIVIITILTVFGFYLGNIIFRGF